MLALFDQEKNLPALIHMLYVLHSQGDLQSILLWTAQEVRKSVDVAPLSFFFLLWQSSTILIIIHIFKHNFLLLKNNIKMELFFMLGSKEQFEKLWLLIFKSPEFVDYILQISRYRTFSNMILNQNSWIFPCLHIHMYS